jgi:hypothetical protein
MGQIEQENVFFFTIERESNLFIYFYTSKKCEEQLNKQAMQNRELAKSQVKTCQPRDISDNHNNSNNILTKRHKKWCNNTLRVFSIFGTSRVV